MLLAIEQASINKQLIAGTRWEINEELSDFSTGAYSLRYVFRKYNEEPVEYNSESGSHQFIFTPEQTAALTGGYYVVALYAIDLSDSGKIYPVASTVVNVIGDVNVISDARSFELKMVEKLEIALLALADKTMSSVSIEGTSYNYHDIGRLEQLRDYYKNKAGIKSDQTPKRRILARFSNE